MQDAHAAAGEQGLPPSPWHGGEEKTVLDAVCGHFTAILFWESLNVAASLCLTCRLHAGLLL